MTSKYDRLMHQVETELRRFDRESTRHKRMFRWFRNIALGLTALATVLASAGLLFPTASESLGFALVVVTAVTGFIGSIEGLRKPSELWMIERNIFHTLADLRRELEYHGPEGIDDERLDTYFARLQDILYSSSQKWSKHIKEPLGQQAAGRRAEGSAPVERHEGAG